MKGDSAKRYMLWGKKTQAEFLEKKPQQVK